MHLYRDYIASGIFLILPIINFAVAAPVQVQEKVQARVDVVHIPKHAMTILGKRQGVLDDIIWDPKGYFVRLEDLAKPEESSATRPSSSSQPSGLADGPTDVEQPLPSISNEPSVSSPDRAPPNLAARPSLSSQPLGPASGSVDVEQPLRPFHEELLPVSSQVHASPNIADELNKMWRDLIQGHFPSEPEGSSAARPSSSSQPLRPAGGSVGVEQPLRPFHEELLPVSSQVHASPSIADELNKMWHGLIQSHSPSEPKGSSAARPSSSSQLSGPASGSVDVEQPLQPIHEELLPVSSQVHASPNIADELNKMWHGLIQGHFPSEPEGSSAARPSSSSQPLGPAGGSMGVEQPLRLIHEELLPVSSQVHASPNIADELNKMWHGLIQGHFPSEPEGSSAARPSSSSQLSGPAGGSVDVEQPLRPIHKELLPVSSQVHASPRIADELNKMWHGLIQGHFPSEPEGSSAARPSSSSQLSGPAGGSVDGEQLLRPIHEELLPVSSQVHASTSIADEMNKMWRDLIQGHFPSEPERSLAARPSSSSQPSGPAGGSVDVEQPLRPIHEGLLPVSSQVHASTSIADEMNKMWRDLIQGHFPSEPERSLAAHPSSSSQPSGPAGGSVNVGQPLRPMHEELLPVSSQVHASPSIADELNKSWRDLIQGHFPSEPESSAGPSQVSNPDRAPLSADDSHGMWNIIGHPKSHSFSNPEESSATLSSSISLPSGPADGSQAVEKLLPSSSEGPSQASYPDHAPLRADNELMKMWRDITDSAKPEESSAARTLFGLASGSSTESAHETVGVPPPPGSASPIVPPESSVLSTNPDGQWMGADFSSGKRKRP